MANRASWLLLAGLALGACTAAEEEPEAPFVSAAARRAQQAADSARATPPVEALRREVFSYRGGSRDPFESLLASALIGPELPDLTLVAVYVDHASPDRSVAVLRERVTGRRYSLHPGDRVGRISVAGIREQDVDFIVDDFGTQRRETLTLRKRQEDDTP